MSESAMQVRLRMTALGWHSEDRLSDIGWGAKVGYTIWFKRWDWHGNSKRGAAVTFNRGTSDLTKIDEIVLECSKVALVAWDKYQDPMDLPYEDVNGNLVEAAHIRRLCDIRRLCADFLLVPPVPPSSK
jgi:hypothetical protein